MSDRLPENPKAVHGAQKPDLSLVPGVALVAEALAMEDGARKYGAYNWRESRIEARTYVAAAIRHLQAWLDGEELTSDTGVPNLGAVRACCGILLDAQASGTLVDNRPRATLAASREQERVKAERSMSVLDKCVRAQEAACYEKHEDLRQKIAASLGQNEIDCTEPFRTSAFRPVLAKGEEARAQGVAEEPRRVRVND